MKLVFTSYSSSPEYDQSDEWLKRIEGYTGILEALAHEHEVTAIERINYEGRYEQNGINYHFIRLRKIVVRFPKRMHRIIKKIQPDVVFVNGFIFPLQIIQLRWRLGRAVKIIILHRAERPFTGLKRMLQKLANKCIDAYFFASNEFGKDWKGIINGRKIYEVIQGSSSFQPAEKNKTAMILPVPGSPVFLWVGRLNKNKDPLTLITAFKKYLAIQPDAVLYIIHQSDELIDECRKLIGTNERIRLVGKVEHSQLEHWLNASDFFISTSHREGSGIAASEAMSCGCIPVLSRIVSFRRMTGPGKCGLLFEPGNADDLFNALMKTNQLDRDAEKEKVLRQFRDELSFEAIARKINDVISIVKKND